MPKQNVMLPCLFMSLLNVLTVVSAKVSFTLMIIISPPIPTLPKNDNGNDKKFNRKNFFRFAFGVCLVSITKRLVLFPETKFTKL